MRKNPLSQATLLALGGVLLSGCGGGGGGDTSSADSGSVVPASNVVITDTNAQQKSREAYDNSVISESLVKPASVGGGSARGVNVSLSDVAMDAIKRVRAQQTGGPSDRLTAQATETYQEACAQGGSIAITVTTASSSTLQAGDVFQFAFNACKPDASTEISGTETMTVKSLSEYSDTRFKATVDLDIQNFSYKTATETTVLNAELLVGYDLIDSGSTNTELLTLQSDKIELVSGASKASIYELDYAFFYDYNSPWAWWFTQDNILDVNGEVIRVDTTSRFDAYGCNYPYQGSGMIHGKNSSVRVTAGSGNVTTLEIDTNGDGIIDSTKQVGSDEVFTISCVN